jgi:cell division protein FtsL
MEPESVSQQYGSGPMSPSTKNSFNWKKVLLFVLVAILVAALSGVSVWAYMSNQNDSSSKSLNAQITTKSDKITSLQTSVKSLQTQIATKTTTSTSSSQQTTSGTGMFESLVAFCGANGNTVQYTTLTNEIDGQTYFGHCAVMEKGMLTGGGIITARFVNNAWQQIYYGQGGAPSSVCTQYKIPTILGTCT